MKTERAISDRAIYRLAGAVLLQAIQDATSRSAGRRAGALRWMCRCDETCYSFHFICRVLNRNPGEIRRFCQTTRPYREIRNLAMLEQTALVTYVHLN